MSPLPEEYKSCEICQRLIPRKRRTTNQRMGHAKWAAVRACSKICLGKLNALRALKLRQEPPTKQCAIEECQKVFSRRMGGDQGRESDSRWASRSVCSATCRAKQMWRTGRQIPVSLRFYLYVDQSKIDGCWPWMGHKDSFGYGKFQFQKDTHMAHRFIYELETGTKLPRHIHVRHKCDNPSCVNISHLEQGTAKQNCHDRDSRGRHWHRGRDTGHGRALATTDTIKTILKEWDALPRLSHGACHPGATAKLAASYGFKAHNIWLWRRDFKARENAKI